MTIENEGHEYPEPGSNCQRCGRGYGEPGYCQGAAPRRHSHGGMDPAEARWDEIEKWLRITFDQDLQRLRPKAIEYGAADLKIMGRAMESLLPGGDSLDPESRASAGLEMAIGFYAMGKAARLYGAWEKGREPDEDSWHDLGIYAMMARYVRANGRWY
jgi:hypothetical protein